VRRIGDEDSEPGTAEVGRFGLVGYGQVRIVVRLAQVALLLALVLVGAILLTMVSGLPMPGSGSGLPNWITLGAMAALALGLLLNRPLQRPGGIARASFRVAVLLSGLQVVAHAMMISPARGVTPDLVLSPALVLGAHESATFNAALPILAAGLGQLLRRYHELPALVFASLAPILPMAALIGASYGLSGFAGAMSPISAALLALVSLAGLASFARMRLLRPLLADTVLGRLARAQIAGSLIFPWLAGLILRQLSLAEREYMGALLIALLSWFVVTMVVLSTVAHERTDVRRRRIERLLRHASVTDRLTGIANRRGVTQAFGELIGGGPVGVIIADLDRFKAVNDTWGHAAGDRMLVEVATALRGALRAGDTVARWGGEEFLVVLPGAGPGATVDAAERLRLALRAIVGPGGTAGEITGSFGVSVLARAETSLEPAILRADTALYAAKDDGRDRVLSEILDPVEAPARDARAPSRAGERRGGRS